MGRWTETTTIFNCHTPHLTYYIAQGFCISNWWSLIVFSLKIKSNTSFRSINITSNQYNLITSWISLSHIFGIPLFYECLSMFPSAISGITFIWKIHPAAIQPWAPMKNLTRMFQAHWERVNETKTMMHLFSCCSCDTQNTDYNEGLLCNLPGFTLFFPNYG